ncbi:MAG: ATPase domain-containing protein [Rhodothermales bacterium]
MTTDVGYAPKLSSGVDLIDDAWGGLYEGGSYLVFGRSESSRGLIPLLFAAQGDASAPSLYLSSQSTRDVIERARQAGIVLNEPAATRIERLPLHAGSPETDDDGRAMHLEALAATVERVGPSRVVIDDFMPFVRFISFDRFRNAFIDMLNRLDAADATLVLTMAEPANEESDAVITFMHRQMTGALHIEEAEALSSAVRRVTFLPNIGHAGCEVEREWNVRRWIATSPIPLSARSSRTEATHPRRSSPRNARWDAPDTVRRHGGTIVRAIRLGRHGERTARETTDSSPNHKARMEAGGSRIPRIPLGGSGSRSLRSAGRERRPGADLSNASSSWTGTIERRTVEPNTGARPVAGVASPRTSHTDREAFRARLQQQFIRKEIDETPFVLVALRMDRPDEDSTRPFDFDFILDLVSESLREEDDMLVDLDAERLVILLSDSGSGAARRFFAHLKGRVLDEAPQQADYLMRSVSAIVVPDGEPFRTAEAFLSYVMDEKD